MMYRALLHCWVPSVFLSPVQVPCSQSYFLPFRMSSPGSTGKAIYSLRFFMAAQVPACKTTLAKPFAVLGPSQLLRYLHVRNKNPRMWLGKFVRMSLTHIPTFGPPCLMSFCRCPHTFFCKKQGWVMRILSHFTHWKIRLKFANWKHPVSNAGSNADTPPCRLFLQSCSFPLGDLTKLKQFKRNKEV